MTITHTPTQETPAEPDWLLEENQHLVELDWCTDCAGEEGESGGLPQQIIDIRVEVDVQTIEGTGPVYRVMTLACGHEIALPGHSRD